MTINSSVKTLSHTIDSNTVLNSKLFVDALVVVPLLLLWSLDCPILLIVKGLHVIRNRVCQRKIFFATFFSTICLVIKRLFLWSKKANVNNIFAIWVGGIVSLNSDYRRIDSIVENHMAIIFQVL